MTYDWLLEAGKIAGAISIIIATVAMLFKFFVLKPMKHFIEEVITEKTYPIQKNSNGGMSLPDANKKLNALDKRIDKLEETHKEILTNQEQMLELLTKPRRPRTVKPKTEDDK